MHQEILMKPPLCIWKHEYRFMHLKADVDWFFDASGSKLVHASGSRLVHAMYNNEDDDGMKTMVKVNTGSWNSSWNNIMIFNIIETIFNLIKTISDIIETYKFTPNETYFIVFSDHSSSIALSSSLSSPSSSSAIVYSNDESNMKCSSRIESNQGLKVWVFRSAITTETRSINQPPLMADEAPAPAPAPETTVVETVKDDSSAAPQEMDLETVEETNGGKRGREEEVTTESTDNGNDAKKAKVDEEKSVEEQRMEKEEAAAKTGPVAVGYKSFETSVQIFDYFFKFLHFWPPNLNVNKYEHAMLLDLLKKGHLEAEKKIGAGINAFQVRYHPQWKSRCFFLVREDASADDFSFRKCVDHILPLPENMIVKSDVNKALGGGGGGGGRGRGGGRGNWRGRGRGGKPRN
ncbi:hypothetical protein L6452_34334 [Arctium lappa]|uniref:Uncharacterized protein n=1 Tax=Arctium lappa TaxID=4217 RepID=A0ACB8YI22_ARCLA|nr:hypothetical protein L6452_34334 [Arctium lappa]